MNPVSNSSTQRQILNALQFIIYGGAILFFARSILIPLAFAVLVSFVVYPICAWMERRGLGRMTAIAICVSVITVFLLILVLIVTKQVSNFIAEWPSLKAGAVDLFQSLGDTLTSQLGISQEVQNDWLAKVVDSFLSGAGDMLRNAIAVSTSSAMVAVLIPIYMVLILYYRGLWVYVLGKLLSGSSARNILELSIQGYHNFVKGMLIVYLIVGVLNSVGLLLLGIPHAILLGILASLLTFIPYVGIMIGSLIPIALAWSTHHSIWHPLGVVGVFALVQYLEANIIFPFAVSSKLKVNTLAVLLAIFVGGLLWGVSGMILFIPLVGILKLIADQEPRLKTLSQLLGTEPRVKEETLESMLKNSGPGH